jgi:hypothetical protein
MSASEEPIGRFEYELTDELVTQGALALCQFSRLKVKNPHIWRGISRLIPALAIPLLLLALCSIKLPWINSGRQPIYDSIALVWLAWVLLGVVASLILVLTLLAIALSILPPLVRRFVPWFQLRRTRKLPHRRVQYNFYEHRFEGQTANRQRTVSWSDVRQVNIVPDFWFLVLKSRFTLVIPAQVLTDEIQALVRRKVTEAGAKIVEWAMPAL